MKYTGRIILLSLSLSASFTDLIIDRELIWLEVVFDSLFAGIAWLIGGYYDKFKFLSYYDFLTHVYNRRYGDKIFPALLAKAKQKKEPIALFNIDVNNFKRLNDSYGHEFGDFILEELAGLLKRETRKSDIVIRWGGDEFLIISPRTTNEFAIHFVETLHEAVKAEFEHINNQNLSVTISVGFSVYPEDGETFDELLFVADRKMYNMKASAKKAPSL